MGPEILRRQELFPQQRKIYYVLYIPDKEIAACLDAIRFLANPEAKWRVHITVRGPYRRLIDVIKLNKRLEGNVITINGSGKFKNQKDQTIFLGCDGTQLHRVWKKQFFGYRPHITLYHGPSQMISDRLEKIVSKYRYNISFLSDRLEPMISFDHPSSSLAENYNPHCLEQILGERATREEVRLMLWGERASLIEKVCQHLESISAQ